MATIPVQVSTPITMGEYAQSLPEQSPSRAFVENMVKESDVLAVMPFLPATAGKREFMDIGSVPAVGFRGVNSPGNEATGSFNLREEDTFFIDEYIKTDRALVDRLGPMGRAKQEMLKTIALGSVFQPGLSSRATTPSNNYQPTGIQARCQNLNYNLPEQTPSPLAARLSRWQAWTASSGWSTKPTHWIFPRSLMPLMEIAARNNSAGQPGDRGEGRRLRPDRHQV